MVFSMSSFYLLSSCVLLIYGKLIVASLCQHGWSAWRDSCYYTSNENTTLDFLQAIEYCNKLNSSLVDIHSRDEQIFVGTLVQKTHSTHDFWIGCQDSIVEGSWRWYGANAVADFTSWCPGEPNDAYSNEDCAAMREGSNNCWNDYSCRSHHNFICEKRQQMEISTTTSTESWVWRTIK